MEKESVDEAEDVVIRTTADVKSLPSWQGKKNPRPLLSAWRQNAGQLVGEDATCQWEGHHEVQKKRHPMATGTQKSSGSGLQCFLLEVENGAGARSSQTETEDGQQYWVALPGGLWTGRDQKTNTRCYPCCWTPTITRCGNTSGAGTTVEVYGTRCPQTGPAEEVNRGLSGEKAKRDFVTCAWDVKHSVAHRPKIDGEVKAIERKELRKLGPDSTVMRSQKGPLLGDRKVVDKLIKWPVCGGSHVKGQDWRNSKDFAFWVEEERCLSCGEDRCVRESHPQRTQPRGGSLGKIGRWWNEEDRRWKARW